LAVGHGENIANDGTIAFHPRMRVHGAEELIEHIYPHIDDHHALPSPQYFLDRVILAPRNTDVDRLNDAILTKLPGDENVLYSADIMENELGSDNHRDPVPVELLRTLQPPNFPPGELHLKPGLRNLAPGAGLCNGTRMIFKFHYTVHFSSKKVYGRVDRGYHMQCTMFDSI